MGAQDFSECSLEVWGLWPYKALANARLGHTRAATPREWHKLGLRENITITLKYHMRSYVCVSNQFVFHPSSQSTLGVNKTRQPVFQDKPGKNPKVSWPDLPSPNKTYRYHTKTTRVPGYKVSIHIQKSNSNSKSFLTITSQTLNFPSSPLCRNDVVLWRWSPPQLI